MFADRRLKWFIDAACRGVDPNVFVPRTADSKPRAFDYCGRFVNRDACLEYALEVGDFTAIMGGTDGSDRRCIARSRAATQATTVSVGGPS